MEHPASPTTAAPAAIASADARAPSAAPERPGGGPRLDPAVLTSDRRLMVRPRPRYAWVWAGIWLAYLYQPIIDAWHEPSPVQRWVSFVALAVFAATFLASFAVLPRVMQFRDTPAKLISVVLVVFSAVLATLITALLGEPELPIFGYVAVLSIFMLPGRWGPVALVVLIGATALAQRVVPTWTPDYSVPFQIFVAGLAMWGVLQIITRNRELDAARREIARLAVEDERNRFARDLHDILGHSLTVLAVKAELAGRLVRLDPGRAEAEINEVERLSREALAEVRSAVAGYRDVTLAAELANARSALYAAGIDADLPTAIDNVPPERRELFGWVVREGVTNVVRHSGASRCRIRIEPTSVSVADNGTFGGPSTTEVSTVDAGHGLVGLRERAEALGGSLLVGRSPEGGFALTVRV